MIVPVTITHLEMNSPGQLRPKPMPSEDCAWAILPGAIPELNRFFYSTIGGDWFWCDRLPWTYRQWHDYLNRPELQTLIFYRNGCPAGYCELERQDGGAIEIVYFGILREFVGNGFGGWALSEVVHYAWALGINRLWVHTCDLDHPSALANYQARGFEIFNIETKVENLPDVSPGPWPGAR